MDRAERKKKMIIRKSRNGVYHHVQDFKLLTALNHSKGAYNKGHFLSIEKSSLKKELLEKGFGKVVVRLEVPDKKILRSFSPLPTPL